MNVHIKHASEKRLVSLAASLRKLNFAGLFYFDGRFRPVPLAQTFIGVKDIRTMQQANDMNEICYDKVGARTLMHYGLSFMCLVGLESRLWSSFAAATR
jgi:hypothetical protein